MKHKTLYINFLLLFLGSSALFSCGKSSGYSTNNTPVPASNSISIVNMSFSPATLTVSAGATVTWTNNDAMTHTVTSDNTGFDSGNMTQGGKFSKVFPTAGTFTYHCSIHSGMKGTIVVK